ncbi:hypothetical protein A3C23_00495 [Candidatus Roizmanbacteria bacterium RIFCSPHIGHO2_02_FULL_37_13b]|uniref:Ribosome recycling factor domain-containing protein n=1 Tax=Candidatus Roizmanbacteria bacterium RIFCSPLOWO2_02_FULL_36_11 TaxID=1802071 RepID=A0A1F7JCZ0_9BACT|nr:MAG: hypothetical protein A3C23_00495 [Candidatus Roizmanbacteria bacterium RIFCSPHIGHO2_02_FULL_37_13b]OGK53478.1 MAG: hypothetical protein A3H78_04605 [Candidatus Roizmanbacteria bacterium RIFCSPLOWO2_02_FULL_36_11]
MFNTQSKLDEFQKRLETEVDKIRNELITIKTGKASPALVENIIVETYGGVSKLKLLELATITTEGPAGLYISPFDPTVVSDIEKAILSSPLHLTPRVEGKNIHIKIPPLTEEQRIQLLKTAGQILEKGKMNIRYARDEIRKKIKQSFENKEIIEDDKFHLEKNIDKLTQEFSLKLDEIKNKKEKEMMVI